MGITGTSYGGCMRLAASAFAPGALQAAVAVSGYGDWLHMIAEQELRHLKLVEYELGSHPAAVRAHPPSVHPPTRLPAHPPTRSLAGCGFRR